MKEKKNKLMNEVPSKGKITFAWILLIILLGLFGGVCYLKYSYDIDDKIDDDTIIDTPSDVIVQELTKIVNNFNSNELVSDYQEENLNLEARLDVESIVVKYVSNDLFGSLEYNYDKSTTLLSVNNSNDSKDINDKIFKIMVLAVQERLGVNDSLVGDKVDSFILGEIEIDGLFKSVNDLGYMYRIDITKMIDINNNLVDNDNNNLADDDTNNLED